MPKFPPQKDPPKDEDGKLVKTATYDELLERVKRPTVQGGDTVSFVGVECVTTGVRLPKQIL